MPGSAAAASKPKRGLVVEQKAIDLSRDYPNPRGHREERHPKGGESVPASLNRGLEVGSQRRRLYDRKTQCNEDVRAHQESDRGKGNLERGDGAFHL